MKQQQTPSTHSVRELQQMQHAKQHYKDNKWWLSFMHSESYIFSQSQWLIFIEKTLTKFLTREQIRFTSLLLIILFVLFSFLCLDVRAEEALRQGGYFIKNKAKAKEIMSYKFCKFSNFRLWFCYIQQRMLLSVSSRK